MSLAPVSPAPPERAPVAGSVPGGAVLHLVDTAAETADALDAEARSLRETARQLEARAVVLRAVARRVG